MPCLLLHFYLYSSSFRYTFLVCFSLLLLFWLFYLSWCLALPACLPASLTLTLYEMKWRDEIAQVQVGSVQPSPFVLILLHNIIIMIIKTIIIKIQYNNFSSHVSRRYIRAVSRFRRISIHTHESNRNRQIFTWMVGFLREGKGCVVLWRDSWRENCAKSKERESVVWFVSLREKESIKVDLCHALWVGKVCAFFLLYLEYFLNIILQLFESAWESLKS